MAQPDAPPASDAGAARPLRTVFSDLAGEGHGTSGPAEVLSANGHPDLAEGLVTEAVVNYADTAPYEVAEHLAPFVRANSSVPVLNGGSASELDWYGLLATAPRVTDLTADVLDAGAFLPADASPVTERSLPADDMGFGHGDTGEHAEDQILLAGQTAAPAVDPAGDPTGRGDLADRDDPIERIDSVGHLPGWSSDLPDETGDDLDGLDAV